MDATMAASTISGGSGTARTLEGISDLKQKLADIDSHRDKYSTQQHMVEYDVSTLPQSMHNMGSDIIYICKDMNGIITQMKEITELLK
jgi:hypothetical protein